MAEIRFDVSPDDAKIIKAIVKRAWKIDWLRKSYKTQLDLRMDVIATHRNGNPLRLSDLLAADDFNFAHDMSGICNCLDRNTGKLTRDFRPRFTQRESEIAVRAPRKRKPSPQQVYRDLVQGTFVEKRKGHEC